MSIIQNRIKATGLTLRYNQLSDMESTTLSELVGFSAMISPSSTNTNYGSNVIDAIKLFSATIGVPEDFVNAGTCGLCAALPIRNQTLKSLLEEARSENQQNHQHLYRMATHHKDESLRGFLESGLDSNAWDVRSQALVGLSELEGQKSTKIICEQLSYRDVDVALDALSALTRTGALPGLVERGEMANYLSGDHESILKRSLPYLLENDLGSAEFIFNSSVQEQSKMRLIASGARPNEDLFVYLFEKLQQESNNNVLFVEALVKSAPESVESNGLIERLSALSEDGWSFSAGLTLLGLLPFSETTRSALAGELLDLNISDFDAKRARAIAVSNLVPSRFHQSSEKLSGLLTFGYARMELMFRFPDRFKLFSDLFGPRNMTQRNLWTATLLENNWSNELIYYLASSLGQFYPESLPFLERKCVDKKINGTIRSACAAAVLVSPEPASIHPILIRCLVSSELGGPVENTPENIGLLFALLDDGDTYEAAADLLRSTPPEIRGIVRSYSDYKIQFGSPSNGIKKAGLTVGGTPKNHQDKKALAKAMEHHSVLAVFFNENLSSSSIHALLNDPTTAHQVVVPLLLASEDYDQMRSTAKIVGESLIFTVDQIAEYFFTLAMNKSWVNRAVASILIQSSGTKTLNSTKMPLLKTKLIEMTRDNDKDVKREAHKACAVLGLQ